MMSIAVLAARRSGGVQHVATAATTGKVAPCVWPRKRHGRLPSAHHGFLGIGTFLLVVLFLVRVK